MITLNKEFLRKVNKEYLIKPKIEIQSISGGFDFFLKKGDKEYLGFASLRKENLPFKHYELFSLDIIEEYRGKNYGSLLIDGINDFLRKNGKIGIVNNGIIREEFEKKIDKKTGKILDPRDFYINHGWEYMVGDLPYLIFNPTDIDTQVFIE